MQYLLLILFSLGSTFTFAEQSIIEIVDQCAPKSHKELILKIIDIESRGNPLAININGTEASYLTLESYDQAKKIIEQARNENLSVDIGLTQINSQHFKKDRVFWTRGFTEIDALDACTNIKMSAYLISDAYRRYGGDILATLSVYNTGSPTKGFVNGYLDRYFE